MNSRRLSVRLAQGCENGNAGRCNCRCRGKLHGANRGHVVLLHPTDPHFPRIQCGWRGRNSARCWLACTWRDVNGRPWCGKHGQRRLPMFEEAAAADDARGPRA